VGIGKITAMANVTLELDESTVDSLEHLAKTYGVSRDRQQASMAPAVSDVALTQRRNICYENGSFRLQSRFWGRGNQVGEKTRP